MVAHNGHVHACPRGHARTCCNAVVVVNKRTAGARSMGYVNRTSTYLSGVRGYLAHILFRECA